MLALLKQHEFITLIDPYRVKHAPLFGHLSNFRFEDWKQPSFLKMFFVCCLLLAVAGYSEKQLSTKYF
jgi:hypothetical protein